MTKYAIKNKRMEQMLRHAGVIAVANSSDRVVLVNEDWGPSDQDPLYRLLAFLEPTSVNGNEHMPSVEEATAMGLIEEPVKDGGFFCDDDFDPVTGGPDTWTDEDQKKLEEDGQ